MVVQNSFASPLHRSFVSSRSQSAHSQQSALLPQTPKPQGPDSQLLYIIVFGYPPDKYTATLEYFKLLGGEGETTDATPHSQITNCFKLGFNNPADALRAVRKNGEVIGGTWMVGVKWAVSGIPIICFDLSVDVRPGPSTCRIYRWVFADPRGNFRCPKSYLGRPSGRRHVGGRWVPTTY